MTAQNGKTVSDQLWDLPVQPHGRYRTLSNGGQIKEGAQEPHVQFQGGCWLMKHEHVVAQVCKK
eukprot:8409287-Karenia_brevis.AAC.1